jgi:hypothetical protein
MSRDDAHHQARARSGIAEIERRCRLPKTARPATFDFPDIPVLFGWRSESGNGSGRINDVLGFQETTNASRAGRQRPKNQGPVRNRFISGEPNAAAQWRCAHHGKGLRSRGFQDRKSRLKDNRRANLAHELRAIWACTATPCQR